jgi:DNA-binding GntR family transcriptional regulator
MNASWDPPKINRSSASLTEQTYRTLKDAILSLHLPPGSRLVEADLAEAMGTSVTPVREALRSLQSHGWVRLSHGRSATVLGLSLDDIRDLYQVRQILETWALSKAVLSFQEEDIERLKRLSREAERLLENGDVSGFVQVNRSFHRELCRPAGNRYLLGQLDAIADQLHRVRVAEQSQASGRPGYSTADALETHRQIVRAIEARDSELAVRLLHKDIGAILDDLDSGRFEPIESVLDPGSRALSRDSVL